MKLRIQGKSKGFTLIEIAIGVTTLSILTTIAIYALTGAKEDTQLKKREATLGLIEQAKTRYMIDNPTDIFGTETILAHVMPYMKKEGDSVDSLFKLAEGTGKSPYSLDLGSYGQRPASFDGTGVSPISASVSNPYGSFNNFLAAAGLNPDFSLIPPATTPNWSNVLNTEEGAAALEEYIEQIPPSLLVGMATSPSLALSAAQILLANMPVSPESLIAAREIFFRSINPSDSLYASRGDLSYFNQPWKWPDGYPYTGINFSGSGITGANLNPENESLPDVINGALVLFSPRNFSGANLSGVNMTGYNWSGSIMWQLNVPRQPIHIRGENFTNVNLTGSQNINLSKIVHTSYSGLILTGTGITKEVFKQELRNQYTSNFEASNQQQVQQGQSPYWTPAVVESYIEGKTTGITFDQ